MKQVGHQELIASYLEDRASFSAREKAEHEAAIWKTASKDDRRTQIDTYLRARLGRGSYTHSYVLLNAGAISDPIWKAIDAGKVTTRKGYEILRRARQIAKTAGRRLTAEDVKAAFIEFDAGLHTVIPQIPRTQQSTKQQTKQRFWEKLRQDLSDYITPSLKPIETTQRERVLRIIDAEFAIFQARVRACVGSAAHGAPSHDEIVEACQTLGLNKPRLNKPIDLKLARRTMHKLARAYHPDRNNDVHKVALFRRVLEAFNVLQRAVL